ncbi:hypothetical protein SMJ63A_50068 [Stenotrophomonas geniculata]
MAPVAAAAQSPIAPANFILWNNREHMVLEFRYVPRIADRRSGCPAAQPAPQNRPAAYP